MARQDVETWRPPEGRDAAEVARDRRECAFAAEEEAQRRLPPRALYGNEGLIPPLFAACMESRGYRPPSEE